MKNLKYIVVCLCLNFLSTDLSFSQARLLEPECKNCTREESKKSGEFGTITDKELDLVNQQQQIINKIKAQENDKPYKKTNFKDKFLKLLYGRKTSGEQSKGLSDGSNRNINFKENHDSNYDLISDHETTPSMGSTVEKNSSKSGNVSESAGGRKKDEHDKKISEKLQKECVEKIDSDKLFDLFVCKTKFTHGERTSQTFKAAFEKCDKKFSDKKDQQTCKYFVKRFQLSKNFDIAGAAHGDFSIQNKHLALSTSKEFEQGMTEAGTQYSEAYLSELKEFSQDPNSNEEKNFNLDIAKEEIGALLEETIEEIKLQTAALRLRKVATQAICPTATKLGVESMESYIERESINQLNCNTNLVENLGAQQKPKEEIITAIVNSIVESKTKDIEDEQEKENQQKIITDHLNNKYSGQLLGCLDEFSYCHIQYSNEKQNEISEEPLVLFPEIEIKDYAQLGGDPGAGFEDVREFFGNLILQCIDLPITQCKQSLESNSDFNEYTDSKTETTPYQKTFVTIKNLLYNANDFYKGNTTKVVIDGDTVKQKSFGGEDYQWANPEVASIREFYRKHTDKQGRVIGSTLNTGGSPLDIPPSTMEIKIERPAQNIENTTQPTLFAPN